MNTGKGIPHLRWYIAGLLFLATVINYVDRQTLSIVAPVLTKDLGLDNVEYREHPAGVPGRLHRHVHRVRVAGRPLRHAHRAGV